MRLYLSSYRLGDHPEEWLQLLGGGRRVAVIGNAIDAAMPDLPPDAREQGIASELRDLEELGLVGSEIDLRDYFADRDGFAAAVGEYDGVWVRGGNSFVLRASMALAGADHVLRELMEADRIVYAGYSAGPAVLAPSLGGIELVDPVDEVEPTYGIAPIWDGLGVLDHAFVPHFDSPGHPETDDIAKLVARYEADGTAHTKLRDGQALVIDGTDTRLV